MNNQILEMYNALVDMANTGDEAGARAYIQQHFSELPEDLQAELMTGLYMKATEADAFVEQAILLLQRQGIETIDALEAEKRKIDVGGT